MLLFGDLFFAALLLEDNLELDWTVGSLGSGRTGGDLDFFDLSIRMGLLAYDTLSSPESALAVSKGLTWISPDLTVVDSFWWAGGLDLEGDFFFSEFASSAFGA